jgi:hypothetical protein
MRRYILPVILVVTIAILGCTLRYEIIQKNKIGEETAKSWQQYVITASVQNYNDLGRGDVDAVKENLMTAAIVYAQYYEGKFGKATGTKFATTLSNALVIQSNALAVHNAVVADKWAASLTNSDNVKQ